MSFVTFMPESLMRPVPAEPVPFSTPRAWASLSEALDLAEKGNILTNGLRRALAFGRLTAQDAAVFCAMAEESIAQLRPLEDYLNDPSLLPSEDSGRWFVLSRIRNMARRGELNDFDPSVMNHFLANLPEEHRFSLMLDMVDVWGRLGADEAMLDALKEVTGL